MFSSIVIVHSTKKPGQPFLGWGSLSKGHKTYTAVTPLRCVLTATNPAVSKRHQLSTSSISPRRRLDPPPFRSFLSFSRLRGGDGLPKPPLPLFICLYSHWAPPTAPLGPLTSPPLPTYKYPTPSSPLPPSIESPKSQRKKNLPSKRSVESPSQGMRFSDPLRSSRLI